MLFDYHTHHYRCGHAEGTLRDMIEEAIRLGMGQIGLSDHSPLFFEEADHANPGLTMAKSEFPRYVEEMLELKKEYADRIEIRLGVESDYIRGWMEEYAKIYQAYPLDYIIGSVHYTDGFHVYSKKRWEQKEVDVNETYVRYIQHVQEAAQCGLFDILGHIDAIKGLNVQATIELNPLWDETAKIIRDANVAVEINTSGKVKPCQAWLPSIELIERLHHYGVPLTFGSDSHAPNQLLRDWAEVMRVLKNIGVKELATFKRRERIMVPVE